MLSELTETVVEIVYLAMRLREMKATPPKVNKQASQAVCETVAPVFGRPLPSEPVFFPELLAD